MRSTPISTPLSAHCYHKAHFKPGENVAVVGLGTLGLGAVAIGPLFGGRVVAIGNDAYRLDLARRMGAHATLLYNDPDLHAKLAAFTDGAGIDLVVLTANPWPAYRTAVEIVRPNGRVAIVSLLGRGEADLDFNPLSMQYFYIKGISLIAVSGPAGYLYPNATRNPFWAEDHYAADREADPHALPDGRWPAGTEAADHPSLPLQRDGAGLRDGLPAREGDAGGGLQLAGVNQSGRTEETWQWRQHKKDLAYRFEVEDEIQLYRPRPAKRYMLCPAGGYYVKLELLPEGRLVAVFKGGDGIVGHVGASADRHLNGRRRELDAAARHRADGPRHRPHGAGADPRRGAGALFHPAPRISERDVGHIAGPRRPGLHGSLYGWRPNLDAARHHRYQHDPRARWLQPARQDGPTAGRHAADERLLQLPGQPAPRRPTSGTAQFGTVVLRSRDGGRTWGDASLLADGFVEPSLYVLPSGRLIGLVVQFMPGRNLWQTESDDGGYTWSPPRPITGYHEYSGAGLLLLQDGRLLLAYGHRSFPGGVRAMISRDEGRSWDQEHKVILSAESVYQFCGGGSSVQLADGKIVTAYFQHQGTGPSCTRARTGSAQGSSADPMPRWSNMTLPIYRNRSVLCFFSDHL